MIKEIIDFFTITTPHQEGFFWIPMAIAAVQGIYSYAEKAKADKALAQMGPRPNYTISPERQSAYDLAKQYSTMGFDPRQTAAHQYEVAKQIGTSVQAARDVGGGSLANVASKIGKVALMNDEARWGAADAAQQAANRAALYGQTSLMEAQRNRATGSDIQGYDAMQRAYGEASQQNKQNMFQALNLAGAAAMTPDPMAGGRAAGRLAKKEALSGGASASAARQAGRVAKDQWKADYFLNQSNYGGKGNVQFSDISNLLSSYLGSGNIGEGRRLQSSKQSAPQSGQELGDINTNLKWLSNPYGAYPKIPYNWGGQD